ncbi:class A beta-lactamase-related serine hydrolase [bacterium]|nr:MAG: class A beta-lactamase-related serine hydrolase [bacterium]
MKKTLAAILFLAFSIPAFAQTKQWEKLDAYFDTLEVHHKLMGSVAVQQGDSIIYTRQLGFKNTTTHERPDSETRFHIGSITKTFTSTLVLKAIEQGKLSLDTPLSKFYPKIANADSITIKMLLTHRSGIQDFTNKPEYETWYTQKKSQKELEEIITKGGSDFNPNSKMSYSNSNYLLLTFIVEKVMKSTYAKLLDQYIIKPAGLTRTVYQGEIKDSQNDAHSYKYENDNWVKEKETDLSIPLGAGSIRSTPSDLTKFYRALFTGKLLTEDSINKLKNDGNRIGLGVFIFPFNDKISYGHNGGIDGFNSMASYFEGTEIAFAITSNGTKYSLNNVAIAVLSETFGTDYEIPVFKNIKLTSEELDVYLGVYASTTFPLKITVTKEGNQLFGQPDGQPKSPFSSIDVHTFEFEQAGVVLKFNPETNEMSLKQGPQEIQFKKQQ